VRPLEGYGEERNLSRTSDSAGRGGIKSGEEASSWAKTETPQYLTFRGTSRGLREDFETADAKGGRGNSQAKVPRGLKVPLGLRANDQLFRGDVKKLSVSEGTFQYDALENVMVARATGGGGGGGGGERVIGATDKNVDPLQRQSLC